ncbi:MAG: TonB-dependent receptor [Bacteroidales bacterium]|nr:TonB-dependent receptor [Bacteroidales bacterium]
MKKTKADYPASGWMFSLLLGLNIILMLLAKANCTFAGTDKTSFIPVNAAQVRTITGTVADVEGVPLPGVNITVPGTTIGTVTDVIGNFEISVPEGTTSLEFSYVGYLKETVELNAFENEISVTLREDIMGLEEVVVVGYGSVAKEDLTGAVAVVNAEEIRQMKVDNVTQALAGRTPGVVVTSNSGSPGKLPTIRIRGVGSINNAQPLYVVDGVPIDPSGIAYLNINDIESMSVLKDASALAIYGSRAANGIIEITTRKGSRGEMKISYSGYYGSQSISHHPDMMDGFEFAEVYNEANGYAPGNSRYIDPEEISNVDWYKLMSQYAPVQNHHLNFSGGDKVLYNFSLGAFEQNGIIKNTYLKRYNARLSTISDVKKWLKLGQNVTFTFSEYKGSIENWEWDNGAYYQSILAQRVIEPYDENGIWNLNPYSDALENPMIAIDRNFRTDMNYQLNGNAFAEFTIFRGLTFKSMLGYNLDFSEANAFFPTYEIDPSNRQLYPELFNEFGKAYSYTFDNILTYENQFGDHQFKLMVGNSAWETKFRYLRGSHTRALSNESERYRFFDEINLAQVPYEVIITDSASVSYTVNNYVSLEGNSPDLDRTVGLLGRLEYSYADKYLVTANIRRDGSTRFGENDRFGIFPGFAAAWKLHRESFFENVGQISQLKIRAGWGKIGNDRIGRYEYLSLMNTNMGYSRGDVYVPGASPSKPPNPFLRWEESVTTNLGLDLGMFNGKLSFVADFYNKLTDGMLFNPPAISISGVITPAASNISSMVNRGMELALNYRHREGEFHYDIGGHISMNRMKVLEISEDVDYIPAGVYANRRIQNWSRTEVGYPIGMFYGYVVEGIFQDTTEIANAPFHNKNTAPGDHRYKDINGDNVIDSNDKTMIGNPHPDLTYGFNVSMMYKGFDFNAVFRGMYGHDIFVAYKAYTHDIRNPGYNYHRDMLNRWTTERTDTDIFGYNRQTNDLNMEESTFYIEDGSFLRLQNIQLGYSLPEKITGALKIDRFRIYISAQNLMTLTNYKYGDPDIGTLTVFQGTNQRSGITNSLIFSTDQISLPTPRILTFGLDLSF